MKRALYPGTFDPITYGHLDIIERAVKIFDRLIVTVANNIRKEPLFSTEERMEMIRETTHHMKSAVTVDKIDGLLVDYAREKNVHIIIRGLRVVTDFEYELEMALANRSLDPNFESVYLMPNIEYTFLSSTIVKEIARLGGDVKKFVPNNVEKRLKEKFRLNLP